MKKVIKGGASQSSMILYYMMMIRIIKLVAYPLPHYFVFAYIIVHYIYFSATKISRLSSAQQWKTDELTVE